MGQRVGPWTLERKMRMRGLGWWIWSDAENSCGPRGLALDLGEWLDVVVHVRMVAYDVGVCVRRPLSAEASRIAIRMCGVC